MQTAASHRFPAAIAALILLALYATFELGRVGPDLYQWSKDWASYDLRQHLGMSKRFLWQYVHLILQCALIFVLPMVLTGPVDRDSRTETWIRLANKYWLPVFLFHFPLLYFVAAFIDHDPTSLVSKALLLGLTVLLSIACGWICFALAPLTNGIGDALSPTKTERPDRNDTPPLKLSGQFSRALDLLKLLAAACVVLGHFSFDEFTDTPFLAFDGAAPRFTIPLFFCISGYLAAYSLHRSRLGAAPEFFKRWWATMPVVIPMLVLVPIFDLVGFAADAKIYTMADEYMVGGHLGLSGFGYFGSTVALALTFMLESVWLTVLIEDWPLGGVGAFNNAPFWFLCYLIPYQILMVAWARLHGASRWIAVAAIAIVTGPPIWLLAPMFFGGAVVYKAHLWYRDRIAVS